MAPWECLRWRLLPRAPSALPTPLQPSPTRFAQTPPHSFILYRNGFFAMHAQAHLCCMRQMKRNGPQHLLNLPESGTLQVLVSCTSGPLLLQLACNPPPTCVCACPVAACARCASSQACTIPEVHEHHEHGVFECSTAQQDAHA